MTVDWSSRPDFACSVERKSRLNPVATPLNCQAAKIPAQTVVILAKDPLSTYTPVNVLGLSSKPDCLLSDRPDTGKSSS